MTYAVLPLDSDLPEFTFRTLLNDQEFKFFFNWNTRDEAWYFSLYDSTGDPIVTGVKVVIGNLAMKRSVDPRRPEGIFVAIDKSSADLDPGRDDLGTRVVIIFTDFQ